MNVPAKILAGVHGLCAGFLIGVARLYKTWISPMIGPHCRFEPTCSDYFITSVNKYGAIRGSLRGIWRICRCHPWSRGGYDPP